VIQDKKWIELVMNQLNDIVQQSNKQLQGTLACRTIGKTGNQEYMVWIK
jgi:predicted rRNA methylase YqxC with S4 and FtsJ domains